MLSTETFLAFYYLGFGFVIFLGWACLTEITDAVRIRRLAVALALAGVLHPALALAGRDLAGQPGRAGAYPDAGALATVRTTTWALVVALGVAALVVASQLGPLENLPILRQVRSGLPFT